MPTFGPLLRRTREQRGVTLDDVARETRLSKRYLTALEEEAIAKLPGGTYNRAYLKTYAAFLALEPDALVRDYIAEEERQTAASQQDLLETMNKAIDKRQAEGDAARGGRRPSVWMMAVAGLVVVAGGIGAAWYGLGAVSLRVPAQLETESAANETPAPVAPSAPAAPPAAVPQSPDVPPLVAPAPSAGDPAAIVPPAGRPDAPSPNADVVPPVSPVAAVPESAPAAGQPETGSAHLTVSGSGVGTAIIDRQLVGQSDRFAVGSRVVFWTHVVGGRAGDTIDHVWLRDGSVVGAASLNVGSPDWRTQSRRVLDPAGQWVVEARDADGRVLARHQFQTSAQ